VSLKVRNCGGRWKAWNVSDATVLTLEGLIMESDQELSTARAIADATQYRPVRRAASEPIPGLPGKTLLDYWSWAYSDIMENVQRAIYAEFLVACALGLSEGVRVGWRSYDLRYGDKRVEVKASAYVQSWRTNKPSAITFGVGKRLEMDDETAAFGTVPARYADTWVFALFEPKAHPAGDILDTSLWRFYVVSNVALETRIGEQKTAGLATIERLGGAAGAFGQGCHHWSAGSSPVASKPDAGLYAGSSLQYNCHDSLGHCEEPPASAPGALSFSIVGVSAPLLGDWARRNVSARSTAAVASPACRNGRRRSNTGESPHHP
jgi:hypothetical protein